LGYSTRFNEAKYFNDADKLKILEDYIDFIHNNPNNPKIAIGKNLPKK
jgi:hypothetical protein